MAGSEADRLLRLMLAADHRFGRHRPNNAPRTAGIHVRRDAVPGATVGADPDPSSARPLARHVGRVPRLTEAPRERLGQPGTVFGASGDSLAVIPYGDAYDLRCRAIAGSHEAATSAPPGVSVVQGRYRLVPIDGCLGDRLGCHIEYGFFRHEARNSMRRNPRSHAQ